MTQETEAISYSFMTLIFSLASSAWSALGKVPHPVSGKMERDLAQAKGSIDMLLMLRDKTKGNLSEREAKMLNDSLADLELNYADEAAKPPVATAPDPHLTHEQGRRPNGFAAAAEAGPSIITPAGAAGSGKGPEIIKP